jgi:alpha-beta hydrolase superfamily lysophospholipase
MISLRVIAKNEHPGKPYILLGHSLGSFAAQQFILDHSHSIDGLMLSGSGALWMAWHASLNRCPRDRIR